MVVVGLHWINFRSVNIFADFKMREIHENMYSAKINTFTVIRDFHKNIEKSDKNTETFLFLLIFPENCDNGVGFHLLSVCGTPEQSFLSRNKLFPT